MEETLKSPYQPCKLLNKILPEKFIGFFFHRQQNKRSSDQFSQIKTITNNKDLLPFHNGKEAKLISSNLDKSVYNNKNYKHSSETDNYGEAKWYVYRTYISNFAQVYTIRFFTWLLIISCTISCWQYIFFEEFDVFPSGK